MATSAEQRPPRLRYSSVSITKLTSSVSRFFSSADAMSAASMPCSAISAASSTRWPMPVERLRESTG